MPIVKHNPSKENNGVRYSDKDEYQQFYDDLTGNSRLSLSNKQKSENKNSSGSLPTFESVERKSLEGETFKGQDILATRGTKNKVSLSENDVNLFKSKLSSVSVKLHSNRFLDAIKQALGFNLNSDSVYAKLTREKVLQWYENCPSSNIDLYMHYETIQIQTIHYSM